MKPSEITAIVLGVLLTAVVFTIIGISVGVYYMRIEAVKYGHARYLLDSQNVRRWEWR